MQQNCPHPQLYSTLIVLIFILHFQDDLYDISWKQVVELYEEDIGIDSIGTTGLRIFPKIREDHIDLTPKHRMKVNSAAQVTKLIWLYNNWNLICFLETFWVRISKKHWKWVLTDILLHHFIWFWILGNSSYLTGELWVNCNVHMCYLSVAFLYRDSEVRPFQQGKQICRLSRSPANICWSSRRFENFFKKCPKDVFNMSSA